MTERKMNKERIEETLERCATWELYTSGMQHRAREDVLDALHDLQLADAEIRQLREALDRVFRFRRRRGEFAKEIMDRVESLKRYEKQLKDEAQAALEESS
ncbi:hypothetical protein LCGC14_2828370 [marine sediment metagenome]|uniref:Uncharacterized protein n=1 Tax=marine sediment metagenome TaxID=412755 RepID=A0A0F8YEV3_9ZZZZ